MSTETPTSGDGEALCAWCGRGPVPPSRGTKPRAYCSRSCVQRAHESRKLRKKLLGAYMKGRAEEAELRGGKSRDDAGKSRDFPGRQAPAKSRDFPKPQVNPVVPRPTVPVTSAPRSKGRRPLLPPAPGVTRETLPLFGDDDTQPGPLDGRADTE
ncbi:hypothetical protein [Streptomyces venezuelae]|uniref:hypothetical protein n=1 Tax=Streptomyces venezuelae TaxID=54571 RepID=UPI003648F7E0